MKNKTWIAMLEAATLGYQSAREQMSSLSRVDNNSYLATSPCWYAYELGCFMWDSGRCLPHDVRMGRGDSIWANDMRFTFSSKPLKFERVQ